MISLTQPALALSSFDAPGYEFNMWRTWKMPKSAKSRDVIYWISYACDIAPELMLKHVVLNTHGYDGGIVTGKGGSVNESNVMDFSPLRAKDIGTIWLLGCEVAATGKGLRFCSQIAKIAGCDVIAGDVTQESWNAVAGTVFMPSGNIDDYEGNVYRFGPDGSQEAIYPNGGDF
jgi:Domain of unknown function (DUF4347)